MAADHDHRSTAAAAAAPPPPPSPPSRMVKTLGAMTGGAVEACVLQPLDVLKTRLQLGGAKEGLGSIAVNMLRNEGPTAFYKGLTPFVTHLVTKYSVRWYFNEFYRCVPRTATCVRLMMAQVAAAQRRRHSVDVQRLCCGHWQWHHRGCAYCHTVRGDQDATATTEGRRSCAAQVQGADTHGANNHSGGGSQGPGA